MMKPCILLALPLALLVACCQTPAPQTHEPTPSTPRTDGPSDAWRACTADADCTLIATTCCDCGADDYVAVHKDHHDATFEEFGSHKKCDCPQMDCPPIDPACRNGLCQVVERGE